MISLRKGTFLMLLVFLLVLLAGCQGNDKTTNQGAESSTPTASPSATITTSAAPTPSSTPLSPTPTGLVSADTQMGVITALRLIDIRSGWIGGEGWIARTDDGGKTWQKQNTKPGLIKQVFALNGQAAWATVQAASGSETALELLATKDGGKIWSVIGKVPNSGFLHFVTANEGYSGNAKTVDGGKTWTSIPVPRDVVGEAYFHDKDHGWAVTQANDKIEVQSSLDGGKSWHSVMSKKTVSTLTEAIIRSTGTNDAWIEAIGGSGMSQTSYSVFHTTDGGKSWQTVIANSTAGAGPAPGFPLEYTGGPNNKGSKPGPLYVVNPQTAFMGGSCPACDKPNTIGWTTDGGKTWTNGKAEFTGYGEALLAMADGKHGWWICTDNADPSVLYTTSDGGLTWNKTYTFDRPKATS
jgi:photosystem II stability/assembly factor-like uncharacterized protein